MTNRFTKIMSAALAAALLTATAASAAPRDRNNYRPAPRAHHQSNSNAAALGFGLFALGALAIIASQSNRNAVRYDDRYYAPPPRPPAYGNTYYGPPTDYYYSQGNYNQGYAPYDTYGYRR